jgi:hypothetical protein
LFENLENIFELMVAAVSANHAKPVVPPDQQTP